MKTLNTRICLYQVVAIVLAIVIIFPCIPFTASAAEVPIEIRTIEDLYSIRNNLSGNYILMNDIDLTEATAQGGDWDSGKGWDPIGGEENPFSGTFDGNGHSIIGLQSTSGGLFYSLHNATIKSLSIKNATAAYGVLAYSISNSEIFNICINTAILSKGDKNSIVGTVSCLVEDSSISSSSIQNVSIANKYPNKYQIRVGGVFGTMEEGTLIVDKVGVSDLSIVAFDAAVGGIIYNIKKGNIQINECFATGSFEVENSNYSVGGIFDTIEDDFKGSSGNVVVQIDNCYSDITRTRGRAYGIGAVCVQKVFSSAWDAYLYYCPKVTVSHCVVCNGTNDEFLDIHEYYDHKATITISNSYYNSKIINETPDSNKVALTEAQMKLQSCFGNLDFVNTWFIDLNTGINHPQLRNNPEPPKVTYDVLYNFSGGTNGPEAQIKYYNQDLKLSAQKPEKTCKITFDPTGGTVSQTNKTVNYTFANWRNEDGTTYAPGATYSKNESANLTAVWNNPTAGTLPTPSRSGFVFDGWYTAANGGYWVTASSELSGDTTLYAHWNEIAVSSLTINRHPTKTTYEIGETLNTSGWELKANYTDGTTKIITSGYMLDMSGAFTTAGTKTVNVSYGGKTVSFTVTVNPAKLTSISVASKPSKTVYYIGDALNTSGLTLTAAYSDGSSKTISSGYTTSGFSSATAGTKTVTVTYQGKTATFTVTVKEKTVGVNDPQIIVESKSARKGEEVILNLNVKNNPGFNSASIRIDYDKNVMTLENAELGELYASCTPSYDNLPYITFYGPRNITSDGLLLKLIFKIKDNAESGDYAVGVTYSEGDIANVAEDDVNFAIISGKISVTKYTPGDINGDGAVNVKDLTRLMRYINHEDVEVVTAALDVNGDGSVNVKDLTRLMRYINHEDVEIH